jgi:hypothetical protein
MGPVEKKVHNVENPATRRFETARLRLPIHGTIF